MGAPRKTAQLHGLLQKILTGFCLTLNSICQPLYPGHPQHILGAFDPVSVRAAIQPFHGPGVRVRGPVDGHKHIRKRVIFAPSGIEVNQIDKGLIFHLIVLIHELIHDLLGYQTDLPLLRNAKIRLQIDLIKVIANHIGAEGVDGRNLRGVNQGELPL